MLKRAELRATSQDGADDKKSAGLRSDYKSSKRESRSKSTEKMRSIRKFSNSSENEIDE